MTCYRKTREQSFGVRSHHSMEMLNTKLKFSSTRQFFDSSIMMCCFLTDFEHFILIHKKKFTFIIHYRLKHRKSTFQLTTQYFKINKCFLLFSYLSLSHCMLNFGTKTWLRRERERERERNMSRDRVGKREKQTEGERET